MLQHSLRAFFRGLVLRYDTALTAAPLRTKIFTSFGVLTGADVFRQVVWEKSLTEDGGGFDGPRCARMAAWGLTIHPIWIHWWFHCMEAWRPSYAVITVANRGAVARLTFQKVMIDSSTGSPAFVAAFLAMTAALEHGSLDAVRAKLRSDWLTTACAAWSFWPLAHIVSLSVIPVHWRLLYINVLSLGWGTYLSGVAAASTTTSPERRRTSSSNALLPIDFAWNALTGGTQGLAGARGATSVVVGLTSVGWCGLAALYWTTRARTGLPGFGIAALGCATTALIASSVDLTEEGSHERAG